MIDTHSHIYLPEFDADRNAVIARAKAAGIAHIILPNVDGETLKPMLHLETSDPAFFHAAVGLHPTSVSDGYRQELKWVEDELKNHSYCAVGEVGMDLYWDAAFKHEQIDAFEQQLQWAAAYDLPVIIHQRNAFNETVSCVKNIGSERLRGVFHSFGGTLEEAQTVISLGRFYLGINGIVTFKNSALREVVSHVSPENLLLETDAPYLAPTPYRGKRNESAYLTLVAQCLSELFKTAAGTIDEITTRNALKLFAIESY